MRPLTADDLLPLEEYASRRREFFAAQGRYLDRYRRARVGPRATLVFENRQTLWYRVQEVIRVARLTDPAHLQQELDLYNRLLPGKNRLQAALVIAVDDETRLTEELAPWRDLTGEALRLRLGSRTIRADLLTCRPEDRAIGAAQWVEFALGDADRRLLADLRRPAAVEIALPAYAYQEPLTDEVRTSLAEDLQLSDRDGA